MAKILTINYYEYEPATSKYSIGDRDIAFMYLGNNTVGSFSVSLGNEPSPTQYATLGLSSSDSSTESGGYATMALFWDSDGNEPLDNEVYSTQEGVAYVEVPKGEDIYIQLNAYEYNGYFIRWIMDFEYEVIVGDIESNYCNIRVYTSTRINTYNIQAQFSSDPPWILN